MRKNGKKYWLAVAPVEHVISAVEEGYCQLVSGKDIPLRRMEKGDGLIYYSSTKSLKNATAVKAFTAIGFIADNEIYTYKVTNYFHPFRRNVVYFKRAKRVEMDGLQTRLQFVDNNLRYSYKFRYGHLEISEGDFRLIADKMGIRQIK